ncbi:Helix-turn-helix domain-containing protein [Saccharopolyspora antimicrobica]|uniref:Helix-turn-helix domain-containing protein n=1 Tax=Saccharopolyspora antimicrobica TaxID=455193 RepID=A0A1I5AWF0_9PSEU|nr:helix-turn-helix transcriptional regulator [Saccharopolyspora antimicrobica]RKT86387.1 helix-turn-helix protein [Saccharopolyspora antimicrobica]SFN66720.1 Helix-turn-helix domain-containing protein [Saccharopolyspora antimicrobica]
MVATGSPALLKRWIAFNLRQLRKEAGRDRSEVMERLGMSRAQVGHLETAERLPSKPVLEILLGFYGVSERLPDFLRIVEAARKGKNWWEKFSEAVPAWFNLYLGLETGVAELASFDALLVPGLLQTPRYAEAVIRADRDLSDTDVRQRVELRSGRQHILERQDDPVHLWVVLDESVLTRLRGSAEIMCEQLEHLLTMSQRPRVDIQILKQDAGAHMAQQGGTFSLMTFPPEMVGDPGVVYHELMTTGLYLEDPRDIAVYRHEWGHLQAIAATPEESRAIIQQALKHWKEVTT